MKKKLFIRIGIVVAILLIVSFSDWSFAAEESSPLKDFAYLSNFLTQILARIRVIFAKIAGEFLTNKRVYGEILGLDALLWRYRVVVRNLANIGLGLFFTYTIFTVLFKKNDITKRVKDTLLRLFIAGLGIQTSRFFVSVVMDMSTITLVAAGSLPSQVMSQSVSLAENFKEPFTKYMKDNIVVSGSEILLFSNEGMANSLLGEISVPITGNEQVTVEQFLDDLLPKYDDVSGPLYYMGIAILDSFSAGEIPTQDTGKLGWKGTIINVIFNGGATIVYSLEMMVLCVLAILRIFYLWMFIVLSPFVVLIYCIKKADPNSSGKLIDKTLDSFTKNLNIKSFLINAFKPAIIVLGIGVTVIFVSKMKGIFLTEKPIEAPGVTISSHCQQTKQCNTYMDSPLFGGSFKNMSKTFMEFVLAIITVILVYQIIKFSVNIGGEESKDFITKKIGDLQKNIGNYMIDTPIVPVSGYDEKGLPTTNYVSLGSAFGVGNRKTIAERMTDLKVKEFQGKSNAQVDEIMEKRGFSNDNTLSETQKSSIRNAGTYKSGLEALEEKEQAVGRLGTRKGMSLDENPSDGGFWKEQFGAWLSKQDGKLDKFGGVTLSTYRTAWKDMVEKWKQLEDSGKTLDEKYKEIFTTIPNAVQAYASFFGLSGITSWNELKKKDISKKDENGDSESEGDGDNETEGTENSGQSEETSTTVASSN